MLIILESKYWETASFEIGEGDTEIYDLDKSTQERYLHKTTLRLVMKFVILFFAIPIVHLPCQLLYRLYKDPTSIPTLIVITLAKMGLCLVALFFCKTARKYVAKLNRCIYIKPDKPWEKAMFEEFYNIDAPCMQPMWFRECENVYRLNSDYKEYVRGNAQAIYEERVKKWDDPEGQLQREGKIGKEKKGVKKIES